MAFLIAVLVIAGACYSPDARSCTRACVADSDCVVDQVCNGDHMCAAPSITSCGELVDARLADARVDASIDARPDAPATATLAIHIDGPGSVASSGGETCNVVDCTFHPTPNVTVTLTAVPHATKTFDLWTTTACHDQPAICQLVPPAGTTLVGAKFH